MKKLLPILRNLEMIQVVSVDDDYEKNILQQYGKDNISDYIIELGNELDHGDIQYIDNFGYLLIEELLSDENFLKSKCGEKIENHLSKKFEEEESKSVLQWLKDAIDEIGESITFIKIPDPSQISNIPLCNTLWIIDKEFKGKDLIQDAIMRISTKFTNTVNCFIIYTSDITMQDFNKSWDTRYKYLIQEGFSHEEAINLAYQIFVLLKNNSEEESKKPEFSRFKEVVLESLLGCIINTILRRIIKARSQSMDKLSDFLKNITYENLQTFRYNMQEEGQQNIYKVLSDIANFMDDAFIRSTIINDVSFVNAFKKIIGQARIKDAMQIRKETMESVNHNYEWNQFQFVNKMVNHVYDDAQFGDIYEIKLAEGLKGKIDGASNKIYGVLITQSCDCVIRSNGSRASSIMKLVLYNGMDRFPDGNDKIKNLYTDGIFVFENDTNTPISFFYKNKPLEMLTINDCIVDLTTLDDKGEAIILVNEDLEHKIQLCKPDSWNNRIAILKSEFDNVHNLELLIEKYDNCEIGKRQIETLISNSYGINYSIDNKKFSLKRIGRLSENSAYTVFDYYISHMSRIGKKAQILYKVLDKTVEAERGEKMLKNIEYKNYKKKEDIHGTVLYPAVMVAPVQKDILLDITKKAHINTIFDPFHGSGTALYEGFEVFRDAKIVGCDINPLANLITKVKLQGITKDIQKDINCVIHEINNCNSGEIHVFQNSQKWFREDIARDLTKIRNAIMKIENEKNRLYFWCMMSDIVRRYSNTRSSTYKLHVKPADKIKNMENNVLLDFQNTIVKNVDKFNKKCHNFELYKCDILEKMSDFEARTFDLIITSPPYGDNGTTVPYGQFSMLSLFWINPNDLELDGWEFENYSRIDSNSLGD
jgi:hypothetical protein